MTRRKEIIKTMQFFDRRDLVERFMRLDRLAGTALTIETADEALFLFRETRFSINGWFEKHLADLDVAIEQMETLREELIKEKDSAASE